MSNNINMDPMSERIRLTDLVVQSATEISDSLTIEERSAFILGARYGAAHILTITHPPTKHEHKPTDRIAPVMG